MKRIIPAALLATTLAFAACGDGNTESVGTDSTAAPAEGMEGNAGMDASSSTTTSDAGMNDASGPGTSRSGGTGATSTTDGASGTTTSTSSSPGTGTGSATSGSASGTSRTPTTTTTVNTGPDAATLPPTPDGARRNIPGVRNQVPTGTNRTRDAVTNDSLDSRSNMGSSR